MTDTSLQKSTIVRASAAVGRLRFRFADLLLPRVAARLARDQWFAAPPRLPRADGFPGGGRPFTVTPLAGSKVRGHEWGPREPTAPVVYLVHGWGGRSDQFAGFVEPLVAAGMRVVAFDALAHGESDPGAHGRLTHGVEFGRALDAVFARYGPAHAVVAHSLGAIATYLALRYGWLATHRLVLIAPMVESDGLYDGLQGALGFGRRTRSAFDREVERFTGLPASEFNARRQAARVGPVPTLVIHDLDDSLAPYEDSVALAHEIGARLVTTERLGHRRLLRDETVIAAAVDFLTANPTIDGDAEPARASGRNAPSRLMST
jgi:pimeloyl-ACP methyl ester carboxylesterase